MDSISPWFLTIDHSLGYSERIGRYHRWPLLEYRGGPYDWQPTNIRYATRRLETGDGCGRGKFDARQQCDCSTTRPSDYIS